MKRRISIAALVLFIGVTLAVLWQVFQPREPSYKGKPLTEWLNRVMVRNFEDTEAALRDMGPGAVPFIFARLRKENSRLARAYRDFWPGIPPAIQRVLPQPNVQV